MVENDVKEEGTEEEEELQKRRFERWKEYMRWEDEQEGETMDI